MSGAIADQELMLEQQRLRSDTANAARAEEFREGDKQVGRQEEQIAHASNIITPVIARKTARQRLIRTRFTIYEFATDNRYSDVIVASFGKSQKTLYLVNHTIRLIFGC